MRYISCCICVPPLKSNTKVRLSRRPDETGTAFEACWCYETPTNIGFQHYYSQEEGKVEAEFFVFQDPVRVLTQVSAACKRLRHGSKLLLLETDFLVVSKGFIRRHLLFTESSCNNPTCDLPRMGKKTPLDIVHLPSRSKSFEQLFLLDLNQLFI